MKQNSIIFFGTGTISLDSLNALSKKFIIEAVITKPDSKTAAGKMVEPPVKTWAKQNYLPYFQPSNKNEVAEVFRNNQFLSNLGVVVDYGLIIPEFVISRFALGIINSHFSLLSKYRGADPITFAILNGEKTSGVSLMRIVPALDEGEILAQRRIKLSNNITIDKLTKQLTKLSNKMLLNTLPAYLNGQIKLRPQRGKPSYTRKLTKSDGLIDWTKPAKTLEREVRAYLGWPGSYTTFNNKQVTITKTHVADSNVKCQNPNAKPGFAFKTDQKELAVVTGKGILVIDQLKPAGKPAMSGQAFLAGHKI